MVVLAFAALVMVACGGGGADGGSGEGASAETGSDADGSQDGSQDGGQDGSQDGDGGEGGNGETAEVPAESFSIAFAGDTSFTAGLDQRDPLGAIAEVLSAADLTFVNLETAVAEEDVGTPYPKDFVFKSSPESMQLLVDAGVDGVSNANNHSLDYGKVALDRTLEVLDEYDLVHFGGGRTPDDAYRPAYVEVKGRTVGLVGFSRVPCDWSAVDPDARPGVGWMCEVFEDRTVESVAEAAAEADVVVVMAHWGVERERCPEPYQHDMAARWVEAGADIVVGGHHHVLQGIEQIDDAWVVHGYGNFAFPTARGEGADTAVFTFTVETDGSIGLRLSPARIGNGRPVPLTGADARPVLDTVARYSWGLDFEDDGTAVPPAPDDADDADEASTACPAP